MPKRVRVEVDTDDYRADAEFEADPGFACAFCQRMVCQGSTAHCRVATSGRRVGEAQDMSAKLLMLLRLEWNRAWFHPCAGCGACESACDDECNTRRSTLQLLVSQAEEMHETLGLVDSQWDEREGSGEEGSGAGEGSEGSEGGSEAESEAESEEESEDGEVESEDGEGAGEEGSDEEASEDGEAGDEDGENFYLSHPEWLPA